MKKILLLVAVILILGCTNDQISHFVEEEDVTPVYFDMLEEIPEHEIELNTSYPLLFINSVWNHMPITYYIDNETSQNISWFSESVIEYTKMGIHEWENATNGLVTFEEVYSSDEADISIFWNKNMGSGSSGVKIGEALPKEIVWTGYYHVLLGGEIVQTPYFTSCVNKIIATHEIGHMLGLNHNDNPKSILYSYAWCYQTITPDIIETLEELYSIPFDENHDIYIINASAVKRGKYIDGEIFMGNKGISGTPVTKLSITVNDEMVHEFEVSPFEGGSTGAFSFQNVVYDGEIESLKFELNENKEFKEIYYDNNFVVLG